MNFRTRNLIITEEAILLILSIRCRIPDSALAKKLYTGVLHLPGAFMRVKFSEVTQESTIIRQWLKGFILPRSQLYRHFKLQTPFPSPDINCFRRQTTRAATCIRWEKERRSSTGGGTNSPE